MHASKPPVFARHDTFFGVCEALGQDLGFNANYLRIAFAVAILPAPVAVIAVYISLGLLVALSRLMFPVEQMTDAVVAPASAPATLPCHNDQDDLPLAA